MFHSWALCGDSRTVDAQASWFEGGCENVAPKMRRVREISAADRRAIADAFAAFPPPTASASCPGDKEAHLRSRDASGERNGYVCTDEHLRSPPPYRRAEELLRAATE